MSRALNLVLIIVLVKNYTLRDSIVIIAWFKTKKNIPVFIIAGTCHTKSDRKSIALGFLPHGNESLSLTYLDNLITCGLPCFKENGKGAKEYPESFGHDCCDCCEAQNELYSAQMFSSNGCGDCIKNFIEKSYADLKVKKCVETKNRQARIPMGVLQMEYNCYTCVDEEYGMLHKYRSKILSP